MFEILKSKISLINENKKLKQRRDELIQRIEKLGNYKVSSNIEIGDKVLFSRQDNGECEVGIVKSMYINYPSETKVIYIESGEKHLIFRIDDILLINIK